MIDNVIPFDPLNKRHLGESVAQAMLRKAALPMKDLTKFEGAGIYAIYYVGSFGAYDVISKNNLSGDYCAPIYVGKAVPQGARKGKITPGATEALYKRLNEHKKSIAEVNNLDIDDFFYRALVVDDIWIPLGESLLIAKFSPIWNHLIDGFGNHDPGRGRKAGLCPKWDVLHPGRSWASKLSPRVETASQIFTEAKDYLRSNPPPDNNDMIDA